MSEIRYVSSIDAYLAQQAGDPPSASSNRPLLLGSRLHVDPVPGNSDWVAARTVPAPDGGQRHGYIRASSVSAKQQLKVFYTDVGQGDATLIEAEGAVIIIDGGPNRGFYDVLRDRLAAARRADMDLGLPPRAQEFINVIVVSHFDKDHYNGLTRLLNDPEFRVGRIYHNGLPRFDKAAGRDLNLGDRGPDANGMDSISMALNTIPSARSLLASGELLTSSGNDNMFAKFLRACVDAHDQGRLDGISRLNRRDMAAPIPQVPNVGSDLTLQVLAPITTSANGAPRLPLFPDPHNHSANPEPSESHTINGNSVVLKLTYGQNTFLFGGDLNQPAQKYINQRYGSSPPLRSQVNKACHHGSSDFDVSFLKDVRPEATVFSSGDNGSFDHPLPDAMGAAAKHSSGEFPLVFSTELARDNKTSGQILLGHINARSNGNRVVMAQKKEKAGTKNPWHTFPIPYPGPFVGH